MSVKLRFESSGEGGSVRRSRSFTGFSSLTGRQRSSARNSLRLKALARSKSPRMHFSPGRGTGSVWSLQPEQVDRVFLALSRGLKEYLESHMTEMDFLSSQQRETKRNSRLAFLYDLEKEIRALERHIRRLEFQISKVEELYETYGVQWRLCQGALNMRRAFSLSPSSRGSRESLVELGRSHRVSLQEMSSMEGDLERLLGELHIRMKGLIGFARLCPGDQYEVLVRLGRQRWRIRGRIESDDTQSWEEEEIVFLPHIHHNFEIKVTEAKGLGWLLVGMVTCASADFFVAKPQLMLVDITELGTIKLQLEVTWNPFDGAERMKPLSVSRQSVSSRKSSVYSWTAPSTPSFTEKYFLSMVRQLQDPDGSLPSLLPRSHHSRGGVSLISYLSDPAHSSAGPYSPSYSRATSLGGSRTQLSLGEEDELETREEEEDEKTGVEEWESPPSAKERNDSSPAELQRSTTPDILRNPGGEAADERDTKEVNSAAAPPTSPAPAPGGSGVTAAQRRALALRLGALMAELEKTLQDQDGSDPELRTLEDRLVHLGTILKNNLSLLRRSSSEETLAVEEVLGSFDFLSHDLGAEDDASCLEDSGIGSIQRSILGSPGLPSPASRSGSEEDLVAPLTSGNWSLDQALETHLDLCCILLQMLRTSEFGPTRRELLEEASRQADVLDRVSFLLLEKSDGVAARDVLPEAQRSRNVLLFWDECVLDAAGPFCCHVDGFSRALKRRYTHKVKAKRPGQSDQEHILSALGGPKRRRVLARLRGRSIAELLPLGGTLRTLAALQLHPNHKVCKAASSCISRAAGCKNFRSKVTHEHETHDNHVCFI
ncbi:RIPOR family member 3 isoform X1 [Cololabis saira]|uniref:RIPOR family member 3 isoform X1 n=1 Tax=Cololabis saira TaxID=129043 RepID=UPI002AD51FC5|nr:RIPOR family member 3 isoform X1 [Cololabis saira]